MLLRRLTLATTAVLPSYSEAFASTSGSLLVGRAPVLHRHSTFLSPHVRRSAIVAFSSSSRGGGGGGSDVEETTRTPWSRMKGNIKKFRMSAVMGVEIVPVLGGAEAAAAAIAGHIPGVIVGVGTVIWSTIVKERVNSAPESILKPVAGGIGNILTFLTVVMLGVRVFTVQADSRYINDFPTTIAHPEGCTRVAAEGGNKGIAVPVFTSNVDEVQATVKAWMESQPRTTIETERPGYLHAKCLTLIFGFPDSLGVKIFKNDSGKTEVWVQSELRVGQGDLGVNYRRVENLLGYLGMKLS